MANMPGAEVGITPGLVRALLEEQHPDLAGLELRPADEGWDNRLYRLGGSLVVRLPRRAAAAQLMLNEQRWLPGLAAALGPSVAVGTSAPLRTGSPSALYPWHWSICAWHPGRSAATASPAERDQAAEPLAAFLTAFGTPAPTEAPVSPVGRGGPLTGRDAAVQERLAQLAPVLGPGPTERLGEVWAAACAVPGWTGPALWLHGDLHAGNLVLTRAGGLSAVVDFGDLTSGDPATDLAAAWLVFAPDARRRFMAAVDAGRPTDAATWQRARGWALSMAGAMLASSDDQPVFRRLGHQGIRAVLEDGGPGPG